MAGTILPFVFGQFFDQNGDPLALGKIYTYAAGTLTPQATYSESTLTTAHANPVVLDSAGRATIYLSPTSYKFVLETSGGVTISTVDNVTAAAPFNVDLDITGVAGEALAAGNAVFVSDGSGGRTAGRWYKTDADFATMSSSAVLVAMVPSTLASGASGAIRLRGRMTDLPGLAAGSKYYVSATAGGITATAPANQRFLGVADTATSLILAPSHELASADLTVASLLVTPGAVVVSRDASGSAAVSIANTHANGSGLLITAGGSGGGYGLKVIEETGVTTLFEVLSGQATLNGALLIKGDQSVTLGASTNNQTLNAGVARLIVTSAGGGSTLTGLTGGVDGREVRVFNSGAANTLTVSAESGSSTDVNRFGNASTLAGGEAGLYHYVSNRWWRLN